MAPSTLVLIFVTLELVHLVFEGSTPWLQRMWEKKRKAFTVLTPIWQSFFFFFDDDGNRLNKDEI